MQSDIEIAQSAKLVTISTIAKTLNLSPEDLVPFGHYIAKLSANCIELLQHQANGKLILVTAMSPTPAGEGKTTSTIGLADALNLALKNRPIKNKQQNGEKNIEKNAMVCIREPSLGPVFGLKGGATGGGYSQVLPMEDINLHFTGDFHAITSANNLLAALIDNHIYHGNALDIDLNSITWRRCIDMNDRALRRITLDSTNKAGDKSQRLTGFDITVASEVMAIFCLANSLEDLKNRLGNILIGFTSLQQPVFAKDLQAEGAMTALLKNAFQPNLVQTIGGSPAIVHGGPFANIAHGCNSVIATKTALKLADYVVTEAGFGADLGAEKFIDIKCRQSGLAPDVVVLVATIRALKYHGGVEVADLNEENISALNVGLANIKKHIENLTQHLGLKVVVAINHFFSDTQAEIDCLQQVLAAIGIQATLCQHWEKGGIGALALAHQVLEMTEMPTAKLQFLYDETLSIKDKILIIATKLYGASDVEFSKAALDTLKYFHEFSATHPIGHFPVCIAKTQTSFSSDPSLRGAPTDHTLKVRELRLAHGAGFIVAICGDVMTMPGLPAHPASEHIGVDALGNMIGLR